MKFSKPQYDAKDQQYRVTIDEGIRFESEREGGVWKESLDSLFQQNANALIQETIQRTHGWFSKPLTPEYLKPRLQYQCPTDDLDDFEGTVVWELTGLTISKQFFLFTFTLVSKTPIEKHTIDLADEEEEELNDNQSESPPLDENDEEPLTVGPTRRRLMKMHVMQARAKAAKSLYKAEQMTQAYCEMFGDDTDWEEDDEDDEEDSDFQEEEDI